jgi:hypothetical protein
MTKRAWRKMPKAAEGDISNRVFSKFKLQYDKGNGMSDLLRALIKRL